jgi:hypothetical protein
LARRLQRGTPIKKFGAKSNFKPSKVRDVPPGQPFVQRSVELLESRAMRGLSRHAHRILLRFEVEHCRHAGKENGYLVVTYDQFVEWGVPRKFINPTIAELVTTGLLVVERKGRARAGDGQPSLYRITYLKSKFVPIAGSPYYLEPTNDWKKIETKPPATAPQNPRREPSKIISLSSRIGNRASTPVGN